MSSRRRTIPRSLARHSQHTPSAGPRQSPLRTSASPSGAPTPAKPLYAPTFSSAAVASPQDQPLQRNANTIAPSSTPPSTLYSPETHFTSAPLSTVRWLPSTRVALAAVGSADGSPAADFVSLYAVNSGDDGVAASMAAQISHPGRVHGMCAPMDGPALLLASSDGGVRALRNSDTKKVEAGQPCDDVELVDLGWLPKTPAGREAATGVAMLARGRFCAVGAGGTLFVSSLEGNVAGSTAVARGDAIGFRGVTAMDPDGASDLVVAAGASGVASVWDFREARAGSSNDGPVQTLRHPTSTTSLLGVTVDPAQPHFVIGGTTVGEIAIWDRRGGDGFPLSRIALHEGHVWDVRVVSSSRPGVLLSCGEDSRVWLMDFAAAAGRGAVGGAAAAWRETGEFWRAEIGESDVRNVAAEGGAMLGINAVDAHPHADLFAYASDSAAVTFGSLYSARRP